MAFRGLGFSRSSDGYNIITDGLVFDLDARYGVVNNSGTTAQNNDIITGWTTTQGGTYKFTQTTVANQPNYFVNNRFNNQPYLRFLGSANGGNEHLLAPYSSDFVLQDHTIFMVGNTRETSGNGSFDHYFNFGHSTDEGYRLYIANAAASTIEYSIDDWINFFVNQSHVSGPLNEHIYQMRYEENSLMNFKQDGDSQTTDTPPTTITYTDTTGSTVDFVLGAGMSVGSVARPLSCNISRLIIYDRYLSDSERDQVTNTLNNIYSTH